MACSRLLRCVSLPFLLIFTKFVIAQEIESNFNLEETLERIIANSETIVEEIENFHVYNYDAPSDHVDYITDGGNDMYDGGNFIKFYEDYNEETDDLVYNKTYNFPRYNVSTIAIHPFTTLAWIENSNGEEHHYSMMVSGDLGADGSGQSNMSSGEIMKGNLFLQYHAFQVFDSGDPSICEVFFSIFATEWNSVRGEDFTVVSSSIGTWSTIHTVRLTGRPQNMLMGYILLSKTTSEIVSEEEVRGALDLILLSVPPSASLPTSSLQPTQTTSNPGVTLIDRSSNVVVTADVTTSMEKPYHFNPEELKERISVASDNIIQGIGNFHPYTYDVVEEPIDYIDDGGGDMFDNGNLVKFYEDDNENEANLVYNRTYRFTRYDVFTLALHPFMAVAWIKNTDGEQRSYTINVNGDLGADGRGSTGSTSGEIRARGALIRYHSFQVYDSGDPSICEVYFAISYRQWNSIFEGTFQVVRFSSATLTTNNAVRLFGRPRNVLMGYMLLSKTTSQRVSDAEVRNSLNSFLQSLLSEESSIGATVSALETTAKTISRSAQSQTTNADSTTLQGPTPSLLTTSSELTSSNIFEQTEPATSIASFASGPDVNQILKSLLTTTSSLKALYNNWYSYQYDGNSNFSILDGGNDMFDSGNMISVRENAERKVENARYNHSYSFENFDFLTYAGDPFIALLAIRNTHNQPLSYTIEVAGNFGSDGRGFVTTFNNNFTVGDFMVEYHVFQIHHASDPNICEVYFLIYNFNEWRSRKPDRFEVVQFGDNRAANNIVRITGFPVRVLMGYTLLSRFPTSIVENFAIQRVLTTMVNAIASNNISPLLTNVTSMMTTMEKTVDLSTTRNVLSTNASFSNYSFQATSASILETTYSSAEVEDIQLLPSCSLVQAINSVFRCNHLFSDLTNYRGPSSCIQMLDRLIRCVGSQLLQCNMGEKMNKLDSLDFPFINSMVMLSYLHNLAVDPGKDPHREINTFCFHAGLGMRYPHKVSNSLNLCEEGVVDELLDRAKDFYYNYIWARNKQDICRAFESLKQWFLTTASTRCQWDNIYQLNLPISNTRYLRQLINVSLKTIRTLNSSSCKGTRDSLVFDAFPAFTCPMK